LKLSPPDLLGAILFPGLYASISNRCPTAPALVS
jgi:hypothetical protein